MHDDILKKLEGRLDRRSFLRGSGLFAAAALTVAAFPGSASAQDPAQEPKKEEPKKDEPKKEDKPAEESKKEDAPKPDGDKKDEPDPFKVTRKDEKGRDYRLCPQCGYNMYKQERTWTCENCGYSYTE